MRADISVDSFTLDGPLCCVVRYLCGMLGIILVHRFASFSNMFASFASKKNIHARNQEYDPQAVASSIYFK